MKKVVSRLFAIASMTVVLASCGQTPEVEVPEVPAFPKDVCAKYSSTWYEAQLLSEKDGKYHVKYSDGIEADIPKEDVKYALTKEELKMNDRVLAVWQKGAFYEGFISEIKENGAFVTWDDGSTPSLVSFEKIVKGFPKSNKPTFAKSTGNEVCIEVNGSFLQAKIMSEKDGIAHVILYDNTEKDLPSASVINPIRDLKQLKAKDKVLAIWASSVYYPGEVVSLEADGIIVRWEDGSKPSFVKTGQFIKKNN